MVRRRRKPIPDNWQEEFRARIEYPPPGKVRKWLEEFLDHPDAREAFSILGWEDLNIPQIYWICRHARFTPKRPNSILYDRQRMKEARRHAKALARYLSILETYYEQARSPVDILPSPGRIQTPAGEIRVADLLENLSESLPLYVIGGKKGPVRDMQLYTILLQGLYFDAQYGSRQYAALAKLANATLSRKKAWTAKSIQNIFKAIERKTKREMAPFLKRN